MKNSIELMELRSEVIGKLETIKLVAETEDRDLSTEENEQMDNLLKECDVLDTKITRAERVEKEIRIAASVTGTKVSDVNTEKTTRNWSLFKAINEVRKGNLTGIEAEMHQEAERENRGQIEGIGMPSFMMEKRAYVDQATSLIAPSVTTAFADALVAGGLYNKVGISDLGNMAADTIVPITGANAVAWAGENAAGTDTSADFGKVTLTPNRINGYSNVSNVIIAQNGGGAEAAIMADMGRQVAAKIDANMWASSSAGAGPGAIAATSGVLEFTEAASADTAGDMLEAIQTLADDHGLDGNLGFVNSFVGYSAIKAAAQVASTSALYQDDKLAGYNGYFSSAPDGTAGTSFDGLFGDFSRIFFCSFGPTSILVDPYTAATENATRLVLNQHYDWGLASGASFVKYTSLV
tara:strand:- start:7190 stop:8416 length:1227 start_codon:yes stop_codon:yes gene_type:complete